MTDKEFNAIVEKMKRDADFYIRANAPVRSGRLKTSIQSITTQDGYEISVNVDYMVYTEERWISPRWNGRENPNLYWLRRTVETLVRQWASQYGGKIYVK